MARRSAKQTAKQTQHKSQPRKRVSPAKPWDWVDVIWVAVALLVFTLSTALLLGNRFTALMPEEGIAGVRVVLLIAFHLALLTILAYRAHCRNLSFVQAYRLRSSDRLANDSDEERPGRMPLTGWQSALFVAGFFIVLRTLAGAYTYVTGQLGWVTAPSDLTDLFTPTLFGLIAAIISIVILAPFIEELVFRVIMYDTFARKFGIALAVILQGLIFSLYHFSLWAALPNFLLALACVFLIHRSKTSIPAIVLHILYNAAVVAAAFYLAMS